MVRNILLLVTVTAFLGILLGYFFGYDLGFEDGVPAYISSYEECASAGYPIMESFPEQCATPDGRGFTREVLVPPAGAYPGE